MFLLEQVTIKEKGHIAKFSFKEWMNNQSAVYLYNGILSTHRMNEVLINAAGQINMTNAVLVKSVRQEL